MMTAPGSGVRRELGAAAACQLALLAGLSIAIGLSVVGWLVGIVYLAGLCALLTAAVQRARAGTLGPAGLVTLARAVLVGGVTALVADGLGHHDRHYDRPVVVAVLVTLATVALLLDAVDGRVARRTGTTSALGARFDAELDAFLILVLSVQVSTLVGWWALTIGALRYVFVAVARSVAWMQTMVPARYAARVVAAAQGIVLVTVASGLLPRPLAVTLVAAALALLLWSFGVDVWRLWRARGEQGAAPDLDNRGSSGPHAARLSAGLAGLLVFLVLVAPYRISEFSPAAFVRIPAEAIVVLAVLLVVPLRARRVTAVVAGLALGVLTITKIVNAGFLVTLARPFRPVTDWGFLGDGIGFLWASIGPVTTVVLIIAAVALLLTVPVITALALLRLSRLVGAHRSASVRVLAVLTPIWLVCALLGARFVPGVPFASASTAALAYDTVARARADLRDRTAFAAQIAGEESKTHANLLALGPLRGKDVVLVFVESYGRSAIENPELDPQVDAILAEGTQRLNAAGFGSRSAFLTSPTSGGGSWLAHSTLESGLWIDNQQRYHELVTTHRLTLNRAFHDAGWRTVAVMPANSGPWPEEPFYGFDRVYSAGDLGYVGPRFSFATMPDQYTLLAFEHLERAKPGRGPLMAQIVLCSSHAPWEPLPSMVGWDQLGNGSIFDSMSGPVQGWDVLTTRNPNRIRDDYRQSIEYSLSSLISYVQTYGDDRLVLIFLGDHQPIPVVTGPDASRDVPITIVARDPAVLDRVSGWGWQEGLEPGPTAPVWPMDTFRDRFLNTFGSPGASGQAAAPPH